MAIHISSPTITSSSSFPQFPSISPFKSPPSLLFPSTSSTLSFKINRNNRTDFVVVPKASSTASFAPEIADKLGEVNIFTASGDSVSFNQLLGQSDQGFAVVALLRHFGCPCCWELASTLKESKARFISAGVKLIAIGIGEPKKARMLAERLPFPMDILYADPERKAYDVLGLYYGIGRTFFNPASAKVLSKSRFEALQKAVKNYTIEATPWNWILSWMLLLVHTRPMKTLYFDTRRHLRYSSVFGTTKQLLNLKVTPEHTELLRLEEQAKQQGVGLWDRVS